MPTLLSYSNLDIPETVQGTNLLDYINNRDIDFHEPPAYSERDRTHEQLKLRAFIKDHWKIISFEKEGETLKEGLSTIISFVKDKEFAMIRGAIKAGRNYIKRKIRGIIQKREKPGDGTYFELFNLSKDPKEKDNLSQKNIAMKEEMVKNLNSFVKGKGKLQSKEKIKIDIEMEDRLKALGYMD